jgi:hypothetical protein
MTSAAALSVYAGRECIGLIRSRGITGFEALNLARRPLGLFQSRSEAAASGDDDV